MSLNGASLVSVLVDFPSPSVNVLTTLALILSKNLFSIQPLKIHFLNTFWLKFFAQGVWIEILSSKPKLH